MGWTGRRVSKKGRHDPVEADQSSAPEQVEVAPSSPQEVPNRRPREQQSGESPPRTKRKEDQDENIFVVVKDDPEAYTKQRSWLWDEDHLESLS